MIFFPVQKHIHSAEQHVLIILNRQHDEWDIKEMKWVKKRAIAFVAKQQVTFFDSLEESARNRGNYEINYFQFNSNSSGNKLVPIQF